MKKNSLSILVIGLGLVLLALSYFWPAQIVRRNWSDEQQQSLAAAAARDHNLSYTHPTRGQKPRADKQHEQELQAAREDYNRNKEQLDLVRSTGRRNELILFWAGILATSGGLIDYFRRQAASEAGKTTSAKR
jgi:hypothetical protein